MHEKTTKPPRPVSAAALVSLLGRTAATRDGSLDVSRDFKVIPDLFSRAPRSGRQSSRFVSTLRQDETIATPRQDETIATNAGF